MKLKKGFITHNADCEHILVATGDAKFSGLVRSNKTAAFIVECLKKDTTEEIIIEKMLKKYNAPKNVISSDVRDTINTLRKIGAIDE